MLSGRQFFILISFLVAGNALGYALKTYYPDFYALAMSHDILLITLVNIVLISLILLVFSLVKRLSLRADKKNLYSDSTLMAKIPNILCIKDKNGQWLSANNHYLNLLGLNKTPYKNMKDVDLASKTEIGTKELEANVVRDQQAWRKRKTIKENRTITADHANPMTIEIASTPIFDHNGKPLRLLVSSPNLQQNTELALLDASFNESPLSCALLDKNFTIKRINYQFSSLTGFTADEAQSKPIAFFKKKHSGAISAEIIRFFKESMGDETWSREISFQAKDDQYLVIQLAIKAISQDRKHYIATLIDITVQKQYEKRLSRTGQTDDLTGLASRSLYLEKLTQFLLSATKHKRHAIVCVLDIELFKSVNDSLGYNASEQILRKAAIRLNELSKDSDVVARLRGDEFAILLTNEDSHEKAIFSASILTEKILASLANSFSVEGHEIVTGASIGVAIFPEDGLSAEVLMKNADLAMYEAKSKGGNQSEFYSSALLVEQKERLTMEQDLRKALSRYELELFYQPQYSARSQKLWGAEVLIRWTKDPQGQAKRIPPDVFIPIAEETGMILEIGSWILETACLQMRKWLDSNMPLNQISVNVSARQFMSEKFLESVEQALEKANLPPKHLEIELTETMLVGDPRRIELQLKRLNGMGIKIALDDFGTGYSSLSYLKKFPIDMLKIDQAFIREMTPESKDAKIVKTIINMGHSLNQKVIAEGVENAEQLEFLCRHNCDIIQGYYFSRPLSVYRMSTLLEKEREKHY